MKKLKDYKLKSIYEIKEFLKGGIKWKKKKSVGDRKD